MSSLAFDHVVIYVPNLEQAIKQFTDLGFTVQFGGEHEHTVNALIVFNDQFYIELLSLKSTWRRPLLLLAARLGLINLISKSKKTISWRLLPWVTMPYGPIDWCLRSDNIKSILKRLKPTALPILKNQSYQRIRPDGQHVKWFLGGAKNIDLPYLIQDRTAVSLRVPLDLHTEHANGAKYLRKIKISPKNTLATADNLSEMLSTPISSRPAAANKNAEAIIPLGDASIHLTKQLDWFGKFSLELEYDGNERMLLNCEQTYGAQIWLIPAS